MFKDYEKYKSIPEYDLIQLIKGEEDCVLMFNLDSKRDYVKPEKFEKHFNRAFKITLTRLRLSGKYLKRLHWFLRMEKSPGDRYHCHGVMFGNEWLDQINIDQFVKEFNKVWVRTLKISRQEKPFCEEYDIDPAEEISFFKYSLKDKEDKNTLPNVVMSKGLKDEIIKRKPKLRYSIGECSYDTSSWGLVRMFQRMYEGSL